MFLDDIQLAMSRIAEYIKGYDFEHFKKDYKTVDAVIRNFEIIGDRIGKSFFPSSGNEFALNLDFDCLFFPGRKYSLYRSYDPGSWSYCRGGG